MRDLDCARRWLADRPEVDPSRIGVAGFCLGGGFATLYAVRAKVGAVAVFYGLVPAKASALENICPVVASYGGRDLVMRGKGKLLKRHLEELGVTHDYKMYDGAGHAFMDKPKGIVAQVMKISPFRVEHHKEACADSWRRMLTFFGEHL